jgi:hypothetical protein
MPMQVEDQQGQDSRRKIEEVHSTKSQAQGTGTGTSVERETSGQDSEDIGEENEQHEVVPQKIDPRPRPKWYMSTVTNSRQVAPPERSFRQSKPPQRFGYMALMTELIDVKPSTYEQVAQHGVWQEAMMEEHASIMKNGVSEVMLRPDEKHLVGSRRIYKVKHAADGNV